MFTLAIHGTKEKPVEYDKQLPHMKAYTVSSRNKIFIHSASARRLEAKAALGLMLIMSLASLDI